MLSELSLRHHQDQSAVVMWCTVHGVGEGQVLLENMLLMIMKLFDNANLRDFAYMSLRISSGIKQCLF